MSKIYNKDSFLEELSNNLGRPMPTSVDKPTYEHRPQDELYSELSQDDLVEKLKLQCENIHTTYYETTKAELPTALKDAIEEYGGGSILVSKDDRFEENNLNGVLDEYDTFVWDYMNSEESHKRAIDANIGINFSEYTLAESGTVVLFNDQHKGRSVSLLPRTYIAIVPKSTIVPRFTQAAREIRKQGMDISSCVNLITGPSNSADIEMKLIVGVHGPIKASYIVVNDI